MDLVLDLYKIKVHAQTYMSELGIEYERCECFPVGDCWVFYGCRGVPKVLPGALKLRKDGK